MFLFLYFIVLVHITILSCSLTADACADCDSLVSCMTLYPALGNQILTSSRCQCSSGLVGDEKDEEEDIFV